MVSEKRGTEVRVVITCMEFVVTVQLEETYDLRGRNSNDGNIKGNEVRDDPETGRL